MNGKKARKLRKDLSMSSENHRNKGDLKQINKKTKVHYAKNFDNSFRAVPVNTYQVINPNLNFYRKAKKGK
jgi:hypothetical protein